MKRPSTRTRRLKLLILALCLLVAVYPLSFGPMSRWVARAVSGRSRSSVDLDEYERRIFVLQRFYAPYLHVRRLTFYRLNGVPEKLLSLYDSWFAKPQVLTDGSRVFAADSYSPVLPFFGEPAAPYFARTGGALYLGHTNP